MTIIPIDQAVEVFARGFSFTRSFTYPYLAEQLHEHVWVVRDAPRNHGPYRCEEYVGYGVDPVTLDAIARRHTRGRFHICAVRDMEDRGATLRAGFKSLGYRLTTTEAFMAHGLERILPADSPVPIARVVTPEAAELLAKAARRRQILPEYLGAAPPPMRQYMALDGDKPIGWVGSVAASRFAWCSNMYVVAAYRRRGIARALMTKMLQDDLAAGARANILLASHTGTKLYLAVGYEQIAELLAYVP